MKPEDVGAWTVTIPLLVGAWILYREVRGPDPSERRTLVAVIVAVAFPFVGAIAASLLSPISAKDLGLWILGAGLIVADFVKRFAQDIVSTRGLLGIIIFLLILIYDVLKGIRNSLWILLAPPNRKEG